MLFNKIGKIFNNLSQKLFFTLSTIIQFSFAFAIIYISLQSFINYENTYEKINNSLGSDTLYFIENNEDYAEKLYKKTDINDYNNFYNYLKENYNCITMSDDNFFIPTSENVEKFSIPDSPLYQSDGNSYFTINSLTVNDNYFKNFNIKLFNGKYFNDDDYNTFDNSDEVPLIVGYDYSEIFKLDDTINFYDFYSKTNKTGKNNININTLKSKDIAKFRNKNFGFIFQYFGLLNDISVYKNVRIPLEYCKCNRTEASKRIDKLLERLGILDKKKYTPKELSGGQCQRVSIARALVNNPNIILADEPTGALDKSTGNEVLNILNEINKSGKTVIIVTHDLDIANKCSRIIKIEDGVIIDDKNI